MRWIFRLVGAVIILALVFIGGVFMLPAERIAQIAARQFEVATGREMRIEGDVSPTLWPVIGARVEAVSIANVAGSNAGPMLRARAVDLGVDFSALINGEYVVKRFEADGAEIVLERDASGTGNWVFDGIGSGAATDGASAEGAGGLPPLVLERGVIADARIRFIDHASGTDILLDDVDAELSLPERGGTARVTLAATRGGARGALEAEIGALSRLLSGEVVPVALRVESGGAQARFDGRAGLEPLAAEGQLSLNASALGPLLTLAGGGGPEPLPAPARPLRVQANVTLAPAGSVHLREAVVSAGDNTVQLALDVALDGARPRVTGEMRADRLDLRPYLTEEGQSAGGGDAATGWSRAAIDASALGAVDARISVTTGTVETGAATLDSVRGVLSIDRARAVFTMQEVRAFEGAITGEVVANNRSGLSVGGDLAMRDVNLLPLLRQTAGVQRLAGQASMDLRFLGVGQSVDAIMRSLEGQGQLRFGQGEILGLDLAGMLRNLDASYVGEGNRTIYDSISGAFTIENGQLQTNDLSLASSLVTVASSGRIGLGERNLDLRVIPEALRDAISQDSLRVPLLVTGPWSAPRFRLDLEGLAEARLEEERARLEARAREEAARLEQEARDRVQQEVESRLGIERQEGQSTEDAVRQGVEDAVEDAVGRGLRRLLGTD